MIYFITKRTDHHPLIYKSQKITVTSDLGKLSEMLINPYLGFDVEANGKRYFLTELLLLQIGNQANQVVIDFTEPDNLRGWRQEVLEVWNKCITSNHLFIGHNLKYDHNTVTPYGFKLPDFFDTMVTEQRINLGSGLFNNLKDTYERRLKKFMPEDKEIRKDFMSMNKTSKFQLNHIMYGAGDVSDIIEIAQVQKGIIARTGQNWFIRKVEHPLVKILGQIELKGLHLDEAIWNGLINTKKIKRFQLEKEMDAEVVRLGKGNIHLTGGIYTNERKQQEIVQTDMFGAGQKIETKKLGNINYNSGDTILDMIEKLGLPVPTFTEMDRGQKVTKNSLREEAIQSYIMTYPTSPVRSFFEKLLEYKGLQKFISSYGDKFLHPMIKKGSKYELGFKNPVTNRVHTVLKQCFTDNGRLSSGDKDEGLFNIQNLPAEKEVRQAFCLTAQEIAAGYWFTTIDWSGAELTIMAAMADDQYLFELGSDRMVNGVKVEGDMHSPVATKCLRAVYHARKARKILEWKMLQPKDKQLQLTEEQLWDMVPAIEKESHFTIQDSKGKKYILTEDFLVNKQNNKQLRTDFKPMTFGTIYGMMAKKAGESLNVPKEDGQVIIDVIESMFPKVFRMVKGFVDDALYNGYVVFNPRSGSRRNFAEVQEILATIDKTKYPKVVVLDYVKDKLGFGKVAAISGEARNAPISGTQADMLKESLVEIHNHHDYMATEASLLLSVHDENGAMHKGKEFGQTMQNIMTEVANRYLVHYSQNIKMGAEGHTIQSWTK